MRDYAKVSPQFWTGETGKAIRRRGFEGLLVAVYLMTNSRANMLGLYEQPVLFMAHETALGEEGASKGLRYCIEEGFCSYDEATEMVWVHEMARYQIADALKSGDNRCKAVQKEYDSLPKNPFLGDFFDRYARAFNMTTRRDQTGEKQHVPKAPSKPLRSQEQEQEQEQEQDPPVVDAEQGASKALRSRRSAAASPTPAKKPPNRGKRLRPDWVLPKPWGEWAIAEYPQWTPDKVRREAAAFRDHWVAKPGKEAAKLDWLATWRNWCRDGLAHRDDPKPNGRHGPPTPAATEARNAEAKRLLGFAPTPEELPHA
jgi:hypothetical protein